MVLLEVFMKKCVVLGVFLMCSCKSITYQDVNPEIKPNENLLPALESVVDLRNLEATYTAGTYIGMANNVGTGFGGSGWLQTTSMSGTAFRDVRVNDVINIFNKEVKENITQPYGEKKGYITVKLGYRGVDKNPFYELTSLFTLWSVNFLGFPCGRQTQSLEVEVEIWNKQKEMVSRYVENVQDSEYCAMYWGYGGPNLGRKLAADNIKQALKKIRYRINIDAPQIKKKLK